MFTRRKLAVAASVVLLAALVYLANFGLWVTRDLANSERFAEKAVAAFELESSRDAISELAVARIAEGRPLLTFASPILVDLLSDFLDNAGLQTLLTRITEILHGILFDGTQEGIVLDFSRVGAAIRSPIEQMFPRVAAEIPENIFDDIVLVEPGTVPELSGYAKAAQASTWVAIILVFVLGGFVIFRNETKWKGTLAVGIGVAIGGLVSLVTVRRARSITIGIPENVNVEVLLSNLYDQLARSLRTYSWWILVIGLVIIIGSLVYGYFWGGDDDESVPSDDESVPEDDESVPETEAVTES